MRSHARWCWRAAWSTGLTGASFAGMTPPSSHSTTFSTVILLTRCFRVASLIQMVKHVLS